MPERAKSIFAGFRPQANQLEALPTDQAGLSDQRRAVERYASAAADIGQNLAHLMPLSSVWAGPARNEHLAQNTRQECPPLLYAETSGSTPFRLSIHVGDVGHMLIVGLPMPQQAQLWRRSQIVSRTSDPGTTSRASGFVHVPSYR